MKIYKTRWFVVANRSDAAIYSDPKEFRFVQRFNEPQAGKKESELVTDKPGRSFSSSRSGGGNGSSVRHSLGKESVVHEHVAKGFAKTIASYLDKANQEKKFDELVLAAEPHFLGLLRNVMSSTVQEKITHEINREYVKQSEQDLKSQILLAIEKKQVMGSGVFH